MRERRLKCTSPSLGKKTEGKGNSKKRVTPGKVCQKLTHSKTYVGDESGGTKTVTIGTTGLNCLYANVDQLLNKMEDLKMMIGSQEPDILLFTEVIPKVSQVITEASLRNPTNLLICGDFNYPEIDWEYKYANDNSESITPFLETVQAQFLHQHAFEPTRFRDGNAPGLLDLILTNDENMIFEIIHNPGLGESDHECLCFTLNCYKEEAKNRIRPNFLKADYETIRARLNKINWTAKTEWKISYCLQGFYRVLIGSDGRVCPTSLVESKGTTSI